MATHSSVLAWRIPGMVEPGGPPSVGSHRVRYDWSDFSNSICLFLLLFLLLWETDLRIYWYNLCQRMFCLNSLIGVLWCHVLHLSLYAHFEFIFVYGVRMCSNFIDSQAAVQLSQHHLLRRLFSSLCIFASSVKG